MTILTPDQRLRVFVSSTLQELAEERQAAQAAIQELRLIPVMFELGARPHPPRALYRAYLEQSHIFIGIYWQRYGWVAPEETISGLEDEYRLSGNRPKLIYIKSPAPEREERLEQLLKLIQKDDQASYKPFSTNEELKELVENDLALLLTERFAASLRSAEANPPPVQAAGTSAKPILPIPPTPLIGRERELAEVSKLLLREDVRLVTLLGPGGVGKSRLALEVASRLQGRFKDGIFFVPLASVADPELVVPSIAAALELREEGSTPLLENVKSHLRSRQVLLLLDNLEQLESAAPVLGELLSAAPNLELLVTSRSALRLSAEYIYEVPPLALPSQGVSPLEAIRATEAVRLFEARARAVKPSFSLTIENALAVAEICHRLDGLPLAIELAAARTNLLTPQALLKRLDKRFEMLSGGARDLPSRQQTLRNAIDWSYQLLNKEQRFLFARLAVFVGGATIEEVEAVCSEGDADILNLLASLVEQSLVRQLEQEGEPRFSMLESIKEFALDKLIAAGEADGLRARHADYFLAFAEKAAPHLKGGDQTIWVNRLEQEHDNLRAAFRWSLVERPGNALRLCNALQRFWWIHNHFSEGRRWITEVVGALGEGGESADYANVLNGMGILLWFQGEYDRAAAWYERARRIYEKLGDKAGAANILNNLGNLAIERGDLKHARELHEEALTLRREVNDLPGIAASLSNRGLVALHERDLTNAERLFREALDQHRERRDSWAMVAALTNLSGTAFLSGAFAKSRDYVNEGLRLAQTLNDTEGIASFLDLAGEIEAKLSDDERAARLWGAAETLRQSIDHVLPPSSIFLEAEHLRAEVRERLGEDAYQAAWQHGRALGRKEAVELFQEKVSDLHA